MTESYFMPIQVFKSDVYSMVLSNTTTRTSLLDSSVIKIVELSEDGIVVHVPKTSCSQGHMLTLFVFPDVPTVIFKQVPTGNALKKAIAFTTKVVSIEQAGPAHITASLEFYQKVGGQWKKFTQALSEKQQQLDRLVKAIKD